MTYRHPTVSVYTTCRNEARFLAATLDSIFAQSLEDFEIVLADGASSDATIEILREYGRDPRLKWASEPDEGPGDGFYKALRRATGTYVMCLPVSDCYLSPTWLERCVALLDRDPDVSMVHGAVMRMRPDGSMVAPLHPSWEEHPPPSKFDYFAFWLATFMHACEITYCVRREAYMACYPPYPPLPSRDHTIQEPLQDDDWARCGPHMKCLFEFHVRGYLAAYLPVMAAAVRENVDNLTTVRKRYIMLEAQRYTRDIVAYREALLAGSVRHVFRGPGGELLRVLDETGVAELAAKITGYRATERLMWDQIDEANAYHQGRSALFTAKWNAWAERFGPASPIALYGGGIHTQQLLDIVADQIGRLNIVAIVDQRPARDEWIRGIPIVEKAAFDFSTIEHVIISSKAHQEEIYRELLERLPVSKIERIYGE